MLYRPTKKPNRRQLAAAKVEDKEKKMSIEKEVANVVSNVSGVSIGSSIGNIDDIFVTEEDVFDVTVSFYKDDKKLLVESIDEEFSKEHEANQITFSVKLPSQGDVSAIFTMARNNSSGMRSEDDVLGFTHLEFARFMCLVRKWSVKKELNNGNLLSLNPKIIKAILIKVREQLGIDGIL